MTEWDFPEPVADLCADLAGQGFDVLDERRSGVQRLLVLQGPVKANDHWLEAFVRLSEAHGRWSICVRFEGMSAWVAARAWAAYLDHANPEELDLDRQARFVRDRLAEAARTIAAAPQAEHELTRLGPCEPRG